MVSKCKINKAEFGFAPGNGKTYCFTLSRDGGLLAKVINFGAIITELHVPDSKGDYADVVLGFNNIETYLTENIYAGAIVGRIAGRLSKGRFSHDGKTYQLTQNEKTNHLHGGTIGLDKRIWEPEILNIGEDEALKLTYHSPHGEEGYPGNLSISVIYSLTPDNGLRIDIEAITDKATPFCPTNHTYFNLSGEASGTTENHLLQIDSDLVVEISENFLPSGKINKVTPLENDFRKLAYLADRLEKLHQSHGDLYLLKKTGDSPVKVAEVRDTHSGRRMEVYTNSTCLQLYTGVGLDTNTPGKSGKKYNKFFGICLECQEIADAPNHRNFKPNFINPEDKFHQITEYRFSKI